MPVNDVAGFCMSGELYGHFHVELDSEKACTVFIWIYTYQSLFVQTYIEARYLMLFSGPRRESNTYFVHVCSAAFREMSCCNAGK